MANGSVWRLRTLWAMTTALAGPCLAQAPAPGSAPGSASPPAAASAPAPSAAAPKPGNPVDAQFLQKINALYESREHAVPKEQRADLVLLPALAAMEPAPQGLTPLKAALMARADPSWSACEKWSLGEKQRAALEALKTVGEPGKKFAFNQGIGREAADPAVRAAGLFIDVGEPPILAAARFGYLPAMDALSALVQFEATRLVDEKKTKDACELLVRWAHFGRVMADREFFVEKQWGAHAMIMGLERLRDAARVCPDGATDTEYAAIVASIEPKTFAMERSLLPQGDRMAAEQVLARAFVERAGPSPEAFGATMARATSSGRLLAQYGEAARWQESAGKHGGTFDSIDALKNVYNDWALRWGLSVFDPLLEKPTDYSKLDKTKFAALDAIVGPVGGLFPLRQRVIVEAAGTRLALAVVAFKRKNNVWPTTLASVRPLYVKEIEADPFDPKKGEFHFFVPIRDQPRGDRELPKPHVIRTGLREIELTPTDLALNAQVDKFLDSLLTDSQTMLKTFATNLASSRDEQAATKQLVDQAAAYVEKLKEFDKNLDPATRDRTLEMLNAKVRHLQASTRQIGATLGTDLAAGKLQAAEAGPKIDAAIETMRRAVKDASKNGSFDSSLDDSTFVLYSVGSNQTRDWARVVGEGGTDILLFPSVLSLTREAVAAQKVKAGALKNVWLDYEPANLLPPPPEEKKTGQPGQQQGASPSGPSGPAVRPPKQ